MESLLAPITSRIRDIYSASELALVERAFERADVAHAGQLRKSGDPYITHPVAVAEILVEFGLDAPTLAAALLHDCAEDTNYSLDEVRRDFGDEVANLVDGVTKLDRLTYGPTAESETVRKMVVAMAKDIRVLVIKLADRLHNARTWQFVNPDTASRKGEETLDIYAPLAHRLGMNAVKWELEDLSFKYTEPKKYEEIERLVAERSPSRDKLTNEVVREIQSDLENEKIESSVTGRQKHLYSIYQKMMGRGRAFDDIYDLVGIRVLVEDVRDCYAVLGAIHARWSPVPGRFKDYIAMPKMNLYQSLHTTVIGPNGKAVEIQIRTHEMHRRAEYGIAAHWKYKLDGRKSGTSGDSPDVLWLKQLHEWQQETADVSEFLDALRYDLRTPEVFVFTPKGSVIALPTGATPVDFAYAVHTEVGNACVGAKVNGKLVSLEATLANGDVIEIVTNKGQNAGPSRDWLNFVKSPRARSKIKAWFTRERREEAIEVGKESIARQMRKVGLPIAKILAGRTLIQIAHELNYADIESLYAAIGDGHVSTGSVVEKIESAIATDEESEFASLDTPATVLAMRSAKKNVTGIIVEGTDDVLVKLARCCTPVPGDLIVGFITRGSGVSIHRSDCSNVADLKFHQGDRLVKVSWNPTEKSTFLVNIQIEALDRSRLLSDITSTLSDQQVNILHAAVNTTKDQTAFSRFTFEMADASHLEAVLAAVRKIEGVYDVYRITNS